MDTKLTLKLDRLVIEKAKKYASRHNRSLSRIIESYLKSLVDKDSPQSNDTIEISPYVRSMRTGIKLPSDFDYRTAYSNFLMEKYK